MFPINDSSSTCAARVTHTAGAHRLRKGFWLSRNRDAAQTVQRAVQGMHLAIWPGWSGHDNGLAACDLRWDGHHERAAGQDGCAAGHIQAH